MTLYTPLTLQELEEITLPKWPGCDVDGDPVTREQATEILVRTNGTYFSTNDHEFEEQLHEIFYSTIPKPQWGDKWYGTTKYDPEETHEERVERYQRARKYEEEMGMLNLQYLDNSRVCSSYIGGPHGWCNWDGNIFQRGNNIGKWPTTTDVYEDWEKIAKEFPFLHLTCRLLTHEAGYSDGNPGIAVVYEVANGKVEARRPYEDEIEMITGDDNHNVVETFILSLSNPMREHGVTLEFWKKACEMVAQKRLAKTV